MTTAEIIQIIIGASTLFATIGVSIAIYWLQRHHEIENKNKEEELYKKELENQARNFIIDNDDERDYLPWCIIASNINKHKQHIRKIYTNFIRCSDELQKEILKQAGFSLTLIEEQDWDTKCFNELEKDIEKYNLGKQKFLYDGAKYFHRGFSRYKEQSVNLENTLSYKPIYPKKFNKGLESLSAYVDEYFDYSLGRTHLKPINEEVPIPPVDYVWHSQNLGETEEYLVCYWVMDLVENIALHIFNILNENTINSIAFKNSSDAFIETFEDKYYNALYWLYFTYIQNYAKT